MKILKKIFYFILLGWGIIFTIGGIAQINDPEKNKTVSIILTFIIGVIPLITAVYLLFSKKQSGSSVIDKENDNTVYKDSEKLELDTKKYEEKDQNPLENKGIVEDIISIPIDENKRSKSSIKKYLSLFLKYLFIILKFIFNAIITFFKIIAVTAEALGEADKQNKSSAKQKSNNGKILPVAKKKKKVDGPQFKSCATCDYWAGERNLIKSGMYVEYKDTHVKGTCFVKGTKYPFPRESGSLCPKWEKWRAFRF